jgi:hypothetical protein
LNRSFVSRDAEYFENRVLTQGARPLIDNLCLTTFCFGADSLLQLLWVIPTLAFAKGKGKRCSVPTFALATQGAPVVVYTLREAREQR